MKDVLETMVNRPVATIIVLGAFCHGTARIIGAFKGSEIPPFLSITFGKTVNNSKD